MFPTYVQQEGSTVKEPGQSGSVGRAAALGFTVQYWGPGECNVPYTVHSLQCTVYVYGALHTHYSVQCMYMVHCIQFTVYSDGAFIIWCTVHSAQNKMLTLTVYVALNTV